MAALDRLTILIPETRELDLFAGMLESEGATTLRCPLVQSLDPEDLTETDKWINRCIAGAFDDLILLTGEGLRRLLALSGPRREMLIAALGRLRTVTRGPKPARVLREIGLSPGLTATTPTSGGVLDALAGEDIASRPIGVQLYPGEGAAPLVVALRERGAEVFPVTPYRYTSGAETERVADAIRTLAAGRIGLIAFTASPQVERFFQVAREARLENALIAGLARTPVAAIGPVVEGTLAEHGIPVAVRPQTSFHLKPLVRAIIAWRTT